MRSSSSNAIAASVIALVATVAAAQTYAPYPQPDSGYVTDHANVLDPGEEERIEQWLYKVETESGTEIIVMTINSINDYPGTDNGSIESFATALFNRYGIGNKARNDGILLLVAIGDRKVRIELGAGHGPIRDADASRIIEREILPEFRDSDYAEGITDGVKAIVDEFTDMRIGVPWRIIILATTAVVLIITGVSLILSGKRGWGWVVLGLALVVILALISALIAFARAANENPSSGWSPGGAGGFGGGFSRGGGATGSW